MSYSTPILTVQLSSGASPRSSSPTSPPPLSSLPTLTSPSSPSSPSSPPSTPTSPPPDPLPSSLPTSFPVMEGGSESQKEIGRESQRERERERERSERRKKRGQTVEIPTLKCRNCERQISVYEIDQHSLLCDSPEQDSPSSPLGRIFGFFRRPIEENEEQDQQQQQQQQPGGLNDYKFTDVPQRERKRNPHPEKQRGRGLRVGGDPSKKTPEIPTKTQQKNEKEKEMSSSLKEYQYFDPSVKEREEERKTKRKGEEGGEEGAGEGKRERGREEGEGEGEKEGEREKERGKEGPELTRGFSFIRGTPGHSGGGHSGSPSDGESFRFLTAISSAFFRSNIETPQKQMNNGLCLAHPKQWQNSEEEKRENFQLLMRLYREKMIDEDEQSDEDEEEEDGLYNFPLIELVFLEEAPLPPPYPPSVVFLGDHAVHPYLLSLPNLFSSKMGKRIADIEQNGWASDCALSSVHQTVNQKVVFFCVGGQAWGSFMQETDPSEVAETMSFAINFSFRVWLTTILQEILTKKPLLLVLFTPFPPLPPGFDHEHYFGGNMVLEKISHVIERVCQEHHIDTINVKTMMENKNEERDFGERMVEKMDEFLQKIEK